MFSGCLHQINVLIGWDWLTNSSSVISLICIYLYAIWHCLIYTSIAFYHLFETHVRYIHSFFTWFFWGERKYLRVPCGSVIVELDWCYDVIHISSITGHSCSEKHSKDGEHSLKKSSQWVRLSFLLKLCIHSHSQWHFVFLYATNISIVNRC